MKNEREQLIKGKGLRHRMKHPATSQATDALIGDEEQNRKQRTRRKKQGAGLQHSNTGPFSCLTGGQLQIM